MKSRERKKQGTDVKLHRCGREGGVEDAVLLALKRKRSQVIGSSCRGCLLSIAPLVSSLFRTHPFLTGMAGKT